MLTFNGKKTKTVEVAQAADYSPGPGAEWCAYVALSRGVAEAC